MLSIVKHEDSPATGDFGCCAHAYQIPLKIAPVLWSETTCSFPVVFPAAKSIDASTDAQPSDVGGPWECCAAIKFLATELVPPGSFAYQSTNSPLDCRRLKGTAPLSFIGGEQ